MYSRPIFETDRFTKNYPQSDVDSQDSFIIMKPKWVHKTGCAVSAIYICLVRRGRGTPTL